jgi:hypothetical protein
LHGCTTSFGRCSVQLTRHPGRVCARNTASRFNPCHLHCFDACCMHSSDWHVCFV